VSGHEPPIVVIGVGNTLLRDDGVGVRIAEALERLAGDDPSVVPPATRVVDGGTLDIDVLRTLEGARAVLVVDGLDLGEQPGTIRVLRGDEVTAAGGRRPSGRAGGIGELLALARLMGWLHGPVALVGVQVADITFNLGLSPRVDAAVPAAVEAVRRALWALDAEAAAGSGGNGRSLTGAGA
jgi:hydrogenase maturation protease